MKEIEADREKERYREKSKIRVEIEKDTHRVELPFFFSATKKPTLDFFHLYM